MFPSDAHTGTQTNTVEQRAFSVSESDTRPGGFESGCPGTPYYTKFSLSH